MSNRCIILTQAYTITKLIHNKFRIESLFSNRFRIKTLQNLLHFSQYLYIPVDHKITQIVKKLLHTSNPDMEVVELFYEPYTGYLSYVLGFQENFKATIFNFTYHLIRKRVNYLITIDPHIHYLLIENQDLTYLKSFEILNIYELVKLKSNCLNLKIHIVLPCFYRNFYTKLTNQITKFFQNIFANVSFLSRCCGNFYGIDYVTRKLIEQSYKFTITLCPICYFNFKELRNCKVFDQFEILNYTMNLSINEKFSK